MGTLKVCLIGCGRWGSNYRRLLSKSCSFELTSVIDPTQANFRPLSEVDAEAAIIAAPTPQHVLLAGQTLRMGWPTLIEKPVATSLASLRGLKPYAELVFAGHLLTYDELTLLALKTMPEIGSVVEIECERFTQNPVARQEGPLWNLACHDLSILDRLLPNLIIENPKALSDSKYYEVDASCRGIAIMLRGGRGQSKSLRQTTIRGENGTLTIEESNSRLLLNDRVIASAEGSQSPLENQLQAFHQFCQTGSAFTDFSHTWRITRWLEEITSQQTQFLSRRLMAGL